LSWQRRIVEASFYLARLRLSIANSILSTLRSQAKLLRDMFYRSRSYRGGDSLGRKESAGVLPDANAQSTLKKTRIDIQV
jgi:hypothetical protein